MDNHPTTATLITNRRAQLAHYRAAYAETYGRHLDPTDHEARDPILADLEARTPATANRPHRGHRTA